MNHSPWCKRTTQRWIGEAETQSHKNLTSGVVIHNVGGGSPDRCFTQRNEALVPYLKHPGPWICTGEDKTPQCLTQKTNKADLWASQNAKENGNSSLEGLTCGLACPKPSNQSINQSINKIAVWKAPGLYVRESQLLGGQLEAVWRQRGWQMSLWQRPHSLLAWAASSQHPRTAVLGHRGWGQALDSWFGFRSSSGHDPRVMR